MVARDINARITLALDIVRKLDDGPFCGYHELNVVKHQIALKDTIVIETAPSMQIVCDDPGVPTDETNLCWKAAEILRHAFDLRKYVAITLHKQIPAQGGLAGGSADAAAVLSLCDELWGLDLTPMQFVHFGKQLGADVPYYFVGKTALDTETTGILRPIDTSTTFDFVIVMPDFGVSTKQAYAGIDYSAICSQRDKTWAMIDGFEKNEKNLILDAVHNDFEDSVFRAYPALAKIKKQLLDLGCSAAGMTGSGSTMVGIAPDGPSAQKIADTISYRAVATSTC